MSDLKDRLLADDPKLARAWEKNTLKRRAAADLRALRKHAELTQEEVAARAGISQSQISKMESAVGDLPSHRMMQRYAAACGFDLWLSFAPKGAERVEAERETALVCSDL